MINIVDDTNPYPALLGIDWAIDNHTIINFKKRILSFEYSKIRVVASINPLEWHRYVELVNCEVQGNYLDQVYNFMSSRDYYIIPTVDGKLSGRSVRSCTSDLGDAL